MNTSLDKISIIVFSLSVSSIIAFVDVLKVGVIVVSVKTRDSS
jgi:hypothetical protein